MWSWLCSTLSDSELTMVTKDKQMVNIFFPVLVCLHVDGSGAGCICRQHHYHGWRSLPALVGWIHRYGEGAALYSFAVRSRRRYWWVRLPLVCSDLSPSPANWACLISHPVNDAVRVRMEGGVMEECEASADVLLSDTMDQYRTFQMCERLLHSPAKLANQLLFQIPPHRQAILIERCSKHALCNSLLVIWCVNVHRDIF